MTLKQKLWCVFLILLVLVLDQSSKYWIAQHLVDNQLIVWCDFFNLRLAHNTGAAFSLFRNHDGTISLWALVFLIGLATLISLGLAWRLFIWRQTLATLNAISYALILAGAVGNVIDRIRYGYVIDFFDFHIQSWHYATFNVADCAVVIGVLLLLLTSYKSGQKS